MENIVLPWAIKETSRWKLYKELGLETPKSRRTFRCLCSFHKIISTGLPTYLSSLIPTTTQGYGIRTSGNIPTYYGRTDTSKYFFFPCTIVTSSRIYPDLRNASLTVFKKYLWKEIRSVPHSVYNICNPNGLKLLTRLRLVLSHLNEYRFNHNFEGCINPSCTCSLEVEWTSHFFLYCHYYNSVKDITFNKLSEADINLPNASDENLVNILLYGSSDFSYSQNRP